MHRSLEFCVPFIDHKVLDYCATIPSALKIKGTEKKHLLKVAARQYLPEPVIGHRKQGFGSPMSAWLRGDLRGSVERCWLQARWLSTPCSRPLRFRD